MRAEAADLPRERARLDAARAPESSRPLGWPSRWPLVCLAIFAAIVASSLLRDFWYPDEPDMAEVTRQMVARRDWLQLWLFDKPFDDYPPLYFWITSLFAAVFGYAENVLRLPTNLSAALLLCATAAWVRRRFDDATAIWAVVVLGTTYLFFFQAINMHLDMLLAAMIASTIFLFDASTTAASASNRWGLRALAALTMSAAVLTKGPVGIAVPSAVLGLDALIARDWRRVLALFAVAGVAGGAFLAWTAAFAERAGAESVVYFLTKQNVDRFLGGRSHQRPFYYFAINIWPDLLPWSPLLVLAIRHAWRRARAGHAGTRLLLIWFAFGFVFFSLAASKRNVYFLPVAPAATALVAVWIAHALATPEALGRTARRLITAISVLLVAVGAVAACGSVWLVREYGARADLLSTLFVTAAVFIVGGAITLPELRAGRTQRALAKLPLAVLAAFVALFGLFLPTLDDPLSAKPDARWLRARASNSGELVGCFEAGAFRLPKESSALAFYGDFAMRPLQQADQIDAFLDEHANAIVLVQPKQLAAFEQRTDARVEVERELVIGDDHFLAVRVERASPSR